MAEIVDERSRDGCVQAWVRVIGAEAAAALAQLLPRRAWREALSASTWLPTEIGESVAAAGPSRARLHARLVEIIGPDHAKTMMELLPPVPWRTLVALGVDVKPLLSASPLSGASD